MQVAAGNVTDRPFARTIYTVAAKRFTGDMILVEAGREYRLSWEDGKVVAAKSQAPGDGPARVALSARLVNSSHVARALDMMAKSPDRPPVDILAELARLSPHQVGLLKRRVFVAHAIRVFALAKATFVLDNARTMRADPDVAPLDPRFLIYQGLKTHYSVQRLEAELGQLTEKPLQLAKDALPILSVFGFGETEKPVLQALRDRAWTLAQLSTGVPQADDRTIRSAVYALVSCDCLEQGTLVADPAPAVAPSPASKPEPAQRDRTASGTPNALARKPTPNPDPRKRRPSTRPPAAAAGGRAALAQGTVNRLLFPGSKSTVPGTPTMLSATGPAVAAHEAQSATAAPKAPSATSTSSPGRRKGPTTIPPSTDNEAAKETRALIRERLAHIDNGGDLFGLLGVGREAKSAEVRLAYFALAKKLHPDRLSAVGVFDMKAGAQRLFAKINQAFTTLGDAKKKREYMEVVKAGGEEAYKKAQSAAEDQALRILQAEESFRVGEMALRRNQFAQALKQFEEAVDLNPDEPEYQANLAWTTWVCATDKVQVAAAVQKKLSQAVADSPRCIVAHLYQGRVAKQCGHVDAALESFRRVVRLDPENADAQLELRLLSKRGDETKRGSFFKKR